MTEKLAARNISKSYRKRQVVSGVSMEVNPGEIVGLLGPNGAGKTTCFYMLVGLVTADSGQVYVRDRDVTALPMHARAKMGLSYLPQESSIFQRLTVIENVLAIVQNDKSLSSRQQLKRAKQLLEDFHIGHLAKSMAISLSGGERRRLEIARALATQPRFVLLDEPFAGVDPISVLDIQAIISVLAKKEIGVLITDHNVRETLTICDRAYILNAGSVIAEGEPADLLNHEEVKKVYLGQNFTL